MQARNAAFAVFGLVLIAAGIAVTGSPPKQPAVQFDPDAVEDIDRELNDVPAETPAAPEAEPAETLAVPQEPPAASPRAATAPSKESDPQADLKRVEPRAPLSDLSAPQPPKPPKTKMPDEWKSTRLFNPVAPAAGIIEAQGYHVAIAGVEPMAADETCSFEGKTWPCGARARTAFRSWLRGRALSCEVPPQPDRETIVAECWLGKQDAAEWLVSSGWVKPAAGGPYVEAGQKATAAKKGIYGAPPPEGALPIPHLSDPAPLAYPEVGAEPVEIPTAPPIQPPLTGPFPPPPPAPTP